jgi:nitroreductase
MNSTIKELFNRKSVRAYTDEPVPEEMKRLILEAATQAPTAGNQQMYTILDITDQHLKDTLADTCDHQLFIASAPVVLIFCADFQKWYDAFCSVGCSPRTPGAGDLLLATTDTVIAAQNAVVAAESLGLGSCYIGDILERCEDHRKLLNLPQYVVPVAMLVIGWPTEQQKSRQKIQRCSLEHIVHTNCYRHMDAAELKDMLSWKCRDKGYEEWMEAFCSRKYNSDFSKEMTRSVEEYLEGFRK